jgi:hypothetical protein
MGGLVDALAKPLAEGAEKLGDVAYKSLQGSKGGRFALNVFTSMERTFKGSPEGEAIQKMAMKGIEARNQIGKVTMKPIDDFKAIAQKNQNIAKLHDYSKAPLSQIHASLAGHSAQQALDPLMNDVRHHTMTLNDIEGKLHSEANTYGREVAFGPDGRNLAATIYPMLQSPHPPDRTKAEAMLTVLSQVFKDTEGAKRGALNVEQSGIKSDVQDYATKIQKQYYGASGKYIYPLDLKPGYDKGSPEAQWVEQKTHKYAMTYLAPLITLAHLNDFYKLPASTPVRALWDQVTSGSNAHREQLKMASGIFFHTYHSIMHNDFAYRTGQIAQKTGMPDAAALINKVFHNPGFNNLRMFQLSTFGSAGYHAAQHWGVLAAQGDRLALQELKEIGLDGTRIAQRGGQLTDEELTTAIFHFTNNRLFIDKPLDRARLTQANPYLRVGSMFHGYISKEGRFLTKELGKLMKGGDFVRLAQFAGTVGVIFPATAPLLMSLQTLVRTASTDRAKDTFNTNYDKLLHPQGFGDFAWEYIQLLAHFGAAGAFMQYVHSAENHQLAAGFAGPVLGVTYGTGQDMFPKPSVKTGERNYHPLERDLLRYFTLPIFGNWAAEHVVPKGRTSTGLSLSYSHRRHR